MNEHQTSRTLLKSPPELWAECSDAQSLARHLGEFVGEIRITRLEPESTVAWEGDRTSGTVKLEPSGWGTRVTLTCSTPVPEEVAPEPEPEPEDRPEREPEPLSPEREAKAEQPRSAARGGLFKRVMRFLAGERAVADPIAPGSAEKPAAGAEPPPEAAPAAAEVPGAAEPGEADPPEATESGDVLASALDSLGQAHHRPFSRA
jgi:hypothetical protein